MRANGVIILAIDTAGAACSVALWRDGAILAQQTEPMTRGQAELLMPMVCSLTDGAGVPLTDIDLFAVTTGPGAFTGLRIGLAACAGMALAAGRPIVGIDNFETAAHAVPKDRIAGRTLLVALDSRRVEIFAQPFDASGAPLAEPCCVAPADLPVLLPEGPVLVTGDAAGLAAEAIGQTNGADLVEVFESAGPAEPAILAALAADRADQAGRDAPAPLYLRPPDATPAPAPRQIAP